VKTVNLASKPFVNRRPVNRVATLVWVLALLLLLMNFLRYGDFFRTVTAHRGRLADLEKEIVIAEQRTNTLRERIGGLQLDDGNGTAVYLNGLIHQRIFPWSRLFDDIEDVLPKDVYLTGLSPRIAKVENTPRRRSSSTSRAGRSRPPRQVKSAPIKEQDLDRVELAVLGYSRSEEAMLELVDRLYASPTFLDPELSSESTDPKTGLVSFNIKVTYLTSTKLATPAIGQLADAGDAGAGEGAGSDGDGWQGEGSAGTAGGAVGGGQGDTLAERMAGDPRGIPAAGRQPGGLYGQPGFVAPGGADPGGRGDGQGRGTARQSARPGFDQATGGAAGAGRGESGAGARQNGVIQPGFDQYGQPLTGGAGSGNRDVVVPPRRTPTGLGSVPSATPRFRGGGG
jgi:Tfp pilus assembly protein PilN